MGNCVNKSLPEFKNLVKETNEDPLVLAAKISVWQNKNGLDKWPTISDLGLSSNIKSGVKELFDSNPELANQVYEALGFNSKLKTSLGKELEYKDSYVPQSRLKSFKQYEVLNESGNNIGTVVIEYRGDKSVILHPKLNVTGKGYGKDLYKLVSSKFNVEIQEWNEGAIANTDSAKKMWDSLEKEGSAKRIVDAEQGDNFRVLQYNNQITPQQKQQALEVYSQYLDTIFPDSKVKDIVYHGTNEPIIGEKFIVTEGATGRGIWFSGSRKYAQIQMDRAQPSESLIGRPLRGEPTMYSILLDIKNPKNFYNATGALLVQTPSEFNKQYDRNNNDAALFHHPNSKKPITSDSADQVVVFESEQIHILGTKQDIEGFKEFVGKNDMLQSSNTASEAPIKELESKLMSFLNKIGVKVETIGEGDFVAKAKLMDKIIQVVQGKADVTTLPEEAAHFFVAILKANGTIFNQMMSEITSNPIYKEVYNEYKNIYTLENGQPDIEKIKEEAVGKLIAKNIIKLHKQSNEDSTSKKSLLDRAFAMIKAIINKGLNSIGIKGFNGLIEKVKGNTIFEKAASQILEGDISNLKLDLPLSDYEMLQKTNATQAQIVDSMRLSQSRITGAFNEKIGLETVHFYKIDANTDKERVIHTTPTTVATQDSRKKNKNRFVSEKQAAYWGKIRNRGTLVHSWVEDIVRNVTSNSKVSNTALFNKLSTKDQVLYHNLRLKVEGLISKIKQEDPTAIFFPELKVFDPRYKWTNDKGQQQYGIAGSIDLLVVHGDGTVSIYDWKTTSKKKDLESITIWKTYEYGIQIALYKKMLMDGNALMGVPKVKGIRKSRLVQIEAVSDLDGNMIGLELTGEIPIAGEDTGNEKLNSKLNKLYSRFHSLMETKPPSDKVDRAVFYSRITSIKDTIIDLQLQKNYNHIIQKANDDFEYVNELFNKEDISLEDLAIAKEITDLYYDLFDYIDSSAITPDIKTSFSNIVGNTNIINKKIEAKRIEILQSQANVFDLGGLLTTQRQVGTLAKTFNAFSQQNHPIIALLYENTKRALAKTELDSNKLRADITTHQEVLKKWASSKGLSLQQAYDLIINKKSGNLIAKYSKEYYEAIENALIKDDINWFKANFELDVPRYTKALDNYTKSVKSKTFSKNAAKNIAEQNNLIKEFKLYHGNLATSYYRKLKTGKENIWFSNEWKKLESKGYEPLKEFYEFFTTQTKELSDWLPHFGYKNNFIPSIRKNLLEELGKIDSKIAGNLFQNVMSRVGVNSLNENVDETTGSVGGQVPVYFIQSIQGDKSYDLGRVLQLFGEMSYNYKNMSDIETTALAAMDVLKGQEAYVTSSFNPLGLKINPMTNTPEKTKEANQGYVEMYKTFMDMYLYGIKTANPSKLTKGVDNLNKYTAMTLLGLSVFPAIAAVTANLANTQIQIARNIYFGNKEYAKSLWMLSGGSVSNNTKEITTALDALFLSQIDDRAVAKNRKLSTKLLTKNLSSDHLFYMIRKPDEVSQKAVFLSLLQTSTIDKDGKIVLLSDYAKSLRPDNYYSYKKGSAERRVIDSKITEEVKKTKSIMDMASIKNGELSIEGHPELSFESILAFRQLVKQVNKSIIGNMDAKDVSTYKNVVWMRSLMLFRNWMPRAVSERFGDLTYNRELKRAELGRYKTFFNRFVGKNLDVAGNLKWNIMIGVEEAAKLEYMKQISIKKELEDHISEMEFIDLYKENMAAQWRGLQITAGVLLLIFGAGKFFDDDEEEGKNKFTAKVLKRAYTELSMFVNPIEALNILKSPTAASAPLVTFMRALTHSYKEVAGQISGDKDLQRATPFKYWTGLIPGAASTRFFMIVDKDFSDFIEDINQDD